jgi:septal ring factor EnvC (AmiA/AmiB activator)
MGRWLGLGALLAALGLLAAPAAARTSWREARARFQRVIEDELGLTRQAVDLEQALAAIERGHAGTDYGAEILDHAGRESMRRLAAYRDAKGDREALVRARARAMVKLARSGVLRLTFERQDDDGMGVAERLALGRDLRWLVRHDLHELSVYRRAEARADAELGDALRSLQTTSALRMLEGMQAAALAGARRAIEPRLGEASERRKHAVRARSGRGVGSAERALIDLVQQNWDELDALRGEGDRLLAPVPGPVVGAFGETIDPILRLPIMRNGVELEARVNARVRAMAAGRVVMVSSLPGYEEIVVIDHGGGQLTLVGRLWQVEVAEGDDVKRGQTIGRVAPKVVDDGLGPSVYAELRRADVPVDPAPLLRRPKRASDGASVPDPQDPHDASDANEDGETDALDE